MPCVILTIVCSDMQEEEFERYFFGPLLLPLFLENCVDKSVHQANQSALCQNPKSI